MFNVMRDWVCVSACGRQRLEAAHASSLHDVLAAAMAAVAAYCGTTWKNEGAAPATVQSGCGNLEYNACWGFVL
jgi:hypothetical protein